VNACPASNRIIANSSSPSTIKAPSTDWIVAQRPPRTAHLDPFKPHAFFLEKEPDAALRLQQTATILLTNKECPWRCLMCDLWKNTLTHSVPPGAIPAQIDFALIQLAGCPSQIKLYNSGSFFDPAAIPLSDYPAISNRLDFANNVVVESHPRLINKTALHFRDLLSSSLEVAMGLETIHPEIFPRLNKRFSLDQFASASEFLRNAGIAVRAFVLVNPPFLNGSDGIEWAVKSAQFAFDCGAGVVSLIPTRTGNGAMDALLKSGDFTPPRLSDLEQAHAETLQLGRGRVFADTWDLQTFSQCAACFESRRERLHRANLTQQLQPKMICLVCREA
jgi:radical SAM enzyme (TIGR01210 family)